MKEDRRRKVEALYRELYGRGSRGRGYSIPDCNDLYDLDEKLQKAGL